VESVADKSASRASGPLRVALGDDHPVVRAGLREILESSGDITVVAEAADGRTLVRDVERLRPDVVVVDVGMPELNGIDATRTIRRRLPDVRVLVISVQCTQAAVLDAIDARAGGYMLKDASPQELVQAVRAVAANMSYFSPAVARLLADRVAEQRPGGVQLSAREREVVQLLAEGNRLSDIAARLFISVQTVKSHRASAMRKVGARTTADLIRYAIRCGLTSA
jgi:DNA-binding NarL/FixJ family response regulator